MKSGQLRAYILSDEGREITIYRLFDRDMCLFSAPCMMRSIQFEVTVAAEKDTEFWVIPTEVYQRLMEESAPVANYTNELMASRFSDVGCVKKEAVLGKVLLVIFPGRQTNELGAVTGGRDWHRFGAVS